MVRQRISSPSRRPNTSSLSVSIGTCDVRRFQSCANKRIDSSRTHERIRSKLKLLKYADGNSGGQNINTSSSCLSRLETLTITITLKIRRNKKFKFVYRLSSDYLCTLRVLYFILTTHSSLSRVCRFRLRLQPTNPYTASTYCTDMVTRST